MKWARVYQIDWSVLAGVLKVECDFGRNCGTSSTGADGPNVTKAFQRFLERCGLPRMRFHDLRHSCATLLLARRDVSHRMVMELLGHSQIALTMNTYTQVLPELKRETARGMDAILRQNGGTEGGTKVARRKRRPRGRAS